ncbi:MAG: DUF4375 domain-containing protein [Pseudomonadota bacterium]
MPASAVATDAEPYELMSAVIDFVNHVTHEGRYRMWEIPIEALHAYHADYYYSTVNNGGHSRFIGNSGMDPKILANAESGLQAMGANGHLECFAEMFDWATVHPEEVAELAEPINRAEALSALDDKFFQIDKQDEGFYGHAMTWLRGLKSLKVVPDKRHEMTLEKLCAANPLAAQRADDDLSDILHKQLTVPLHAGLHISGRRGDQRHQIQDSMNGQYQTVDGEQKIVWSVLTDQGVRYAIEREDGVMLYAEVDDVDPDGNSIKIKQAVSGVPADEIAMAMAHAAKHRVALSVVAMLRHAGISTGPDWIAWERKEDGQKLGRDSAVYAIGLDAEAEAHLLLGEDGAAIFLGGSPEPEIYLDGPDLDDIIDQMTDRQEYEAEMLAAMVPEKYRVKSEPPNDVAAQEPKRSQPKKRSLFGGNLETLWLDHHTAEELSLIDQDIRDLHFRLEDPLDAGVSMTLMSQEPPAALLEIGEPIEEWEVNEEVADRIEILTSIGAMTASEISSGVSVHSAKEGVPRKTMIGVTRRDKIDAAIGAAHRYPVAVGLFILLEQAGLTDLFQGACYVQTGGAGLTEILLKNPKIQDALADPLREAMATTPGKRKKKKSPSEHFAILFEGVDGMAIAHFGEQRAVLMPFSGNTDDLFETVPVIPMEELLHEEKAFVARLKS